MGGRALVCGDQTVSDVQVPLRIANQSLFKRKNRSVLVTIFQSGTALANSPEQFQRLGSTRWCPDLKNRSERMEVGLAE